MRVPVTVLIPVKNEAANLRRCLAAVSWAERIVLIDSQSTDATPQIAAEYGAEIVQFHYRGRWPKKRNWALENINFGHEWVLLVDADEVLPATIAAEINLIVSDVNHPNAGYWINRRFMFMGRWLRHAYYPNWVLRLFKHRLGRFEKLTDAETKSGDHEVHEPLVVQGSTGRLKAEMDHYAFPSVEVFVEKHNRYSNWEAAMALEGSAGSRQVDAELDLRRRLKHLSRSLPFRPLLRFFYVYVWQRGFLDGREGYYFARLHATYELLSVAKTYELRKRAS